MRVFILLIFLFIAAHLYAQKQDTRYFEMRTYHCHPGKRPDLIKRFENHTLKLFKKHGIESVAYFTPLDTGNYTLTFILAYPDEASRDVRWNAFANDPVWKEALKKSEEAGPIVSQVDQTFMKLAPELTASIQKPKKKQQRVFELRTYTLLPGKVADINARFRDHTLKLFEKHGMENIAYWYTVEKDGSQSKLFYILSHKSEEAGKASFNTFREDPAWIKARDASEANGKIVEGIVSVYTSALPFSPVK